MRWAINWMLADPPYGMPQASKGAPEDPLRLLRFDHAPGELDAYPVGQGPGEAEAFARRIAAMGSPLPCRDPPPWEHDPTAALATLRDEDE